VRRDVQEAFNAEVQAELSDSVWYSGGCKSWYLDENGVNRTLWPGFTWSYWTKVRKIQPADFELATATLPGCPPNPAADRPSGGTRGVKSR
jgi:hypothetical protein